MNKVARDQVSPPPTCGGGANKAWESRERQGRSGIHSSKLRAAGDPPAVLQGEHPPPPHPRAPSFGDTWAPAAARSSGGLLSWRG